MKVTGSTIQQLDKSRSKARCRKWRFYATTEQGAKYKRFKGTYTMAQAAKDEWIRELEGIVPNAETFASYAQFWALWREKSGDIGIGTITNDKRNINALSRVLGNERMDAITPEKVKTALIELKQGGSATGKELSGTYMNNLFTALNNIMQTAFDDGRIASNPCAKIKPPKTDTKEKAALDSAQLDECFNRTAALLPDGRAMAVLLMLDCGLRTGEALALSPEDVDETHKIIHVRHAMKERDGSIGSTKSPSAVRDLPMTDRLAQACAFYRRYRQECKTFCVSTHGHTLYCQNFQRWWRHNRAKLGAEGFSPHQLRHSNLTKMARFMSAFDLQTWAGWSSIAPARVYVHRDQSALEAAVKRAQMTSIIQQPCLKLAKN